MVVSKELLWASGHDETVEVNQRALIDKVLARYSGEFTVFRELLQNSDDAQSQAVEIHFETKKFLDRHEEDAERSAMPLEQEGNVEERLPDLKATHVHQWTFKNNGILFRDEDWSRLKKIAEGNPDEEKIGAFGVGFYSLFSVTEEPFVTSGDQWMGFYWKDKKDQLFARRGQLPASLPEDPARIWTSFTMALRESAPIPMAFDFTRFLASSITFMRHLSEVTVYFDDKRLVKLTKATGIPKQLALPKGFKNRSPTGMMTVNGVETTPISIQAEVMKWIYLSGTEKKPRPEPTLARPSASKGGFFSTLFSSLANTPATPRSLTPVAPTESVNPLQLNTTSVSLSTFSASVQVQVDKKTTAELVRSTKKNPPSKMKFELIYTAKDEYDASINEDTKIGNFTGSIFQGLRADLSRTGDAKVFIGHSTSQSTGIGGHIAARFIPTVERESIDFMDRYVAVWNKELLYVGGFLSRVAYEMELRTVQERWDASSSSQGPPPSDIRTQLISRVLHALKFFEFHESHPSKQVSEDMRSAFFSCSPLQTFPMISSTGVRGCKDIRIPDPVLTSFVKNVPMIPDEVLKGASSTVAYLKHHGMIKDVEFADIIHELQANPLTEDECIACLKWWITESSRDQHANQERYILIRTQLLNAIIVATAVGEEQKILPLNTIKMFFNPRSGTGGAIPLDGPLPEFLLPVSISKHFKPESLSTCFPWVEFNLIRWLIFITDSKNANKWPEYDLNLSPIWAEKVAGVVSRGWNQLAEESKGKIKDLLSNKTCIPTTNGMKIPSEAYFPNVNIFPDLPIVTFPSGLVIKGNVEKFLQYLDVRKHVELQLVFHRMVKTNEWTVMDLVKYLVSIRDLSDDELQRLQRTTAFPKEMGPGESSSKRPRFMANQLYPPNDVFRALGLPILDWGDQTKWRDRSEEAKFLYKIGLQRYPSQSKLIELCTGDDEKVRTAAFQYLIDHIDSQYPNFDSNDFRDQRFIPALKGSEPCLANITEVFSRSQWASMGYMILQPKYQSYAEKLRIREYPSAGQLVALLRSKPPQTHVQATEWFALLASRVNDFKASDLEILARFGIVPIFDAKSKDDIATQWLPPSQCYLRGGGKETFHSKLFTFVDFGPSGNAFLTACGTRSQPSVEEVARILLNDPHHFYELSGGTTHFLDELRNLAVNSRNLSNGTVLRMKRSPILLGLKRKAREQKKNDEDWDEDEWEIVYDLKRPDEIIVADDTNAYQAFGDSLFAAPQEDILEAFYLYLGSQKLSHAVREQHESSAERFDAKITQEIRALILERLPLFLHEHTHTSTKVSFSWLNSGNNFVVRAFGKLAVSKHLNFNGVREVRKQDASAVSRRVGSGPIELWIATNAQPDMYEVSTSLNRLLFESPKANDALLFMTILSTDLRSLKRRGYNVERILRQQREAKLAAAAAETERQKKEEEDRLQRQLEAKQRAADPETASLLSKDSQSTLAAPDAPAAAIMKGFQNFKNRFNPTPPSASQSSSNRDRELPPPPPVPKDTKPSANNYAMNQKYLSSAEQHQEGRHSEETIVERDAMPGGFTQRPSNPSRPSGPSTATPLENITRNINIALDSCKGESSNLLANRQHMQRIKESAEDGYCDISGRKGNLHNIAELGSVKIYLSEEIPLSEAEPFMKAKHQALARFCHVMKDLANVYNLPLKSLHIFFDAEGGLIAFNRGGSIFLNFRYYEQWHDAEVQRGDFRNAYISWYFSLAHEIAHNLVHPHNSEHEFYFSALCEHHMMAFTRLLGGSSSAV